MLLLYNSQDGEIFYVVKTSDIPTFTHSANIELSTAEIPDEGEELQTVRSELLKYQGKKNELGEGKFFVDTSTNPPTLIERAEWIGIN